MNTRVITSVAIILAVAACAPRAPAPTNLQSTSKQLDVQPSATLLELSDAPESELQKHVGETVTMHGQFSLGGKIAPYIVVGGREIYIKPHGSFSWGRSYAQMEGRDVRVTGTLRFVHYPDLPQPDRQVQRALDHFYFDWETAKLELSQR